MQTEERERIQDWDLGNSNIKRSGRGGETNKEGWDVKIILLEENQERGIMEAKWRKYVKDNILDVDKNWKVTIAFSNLEVIGDLDMNSFGVMIRGQIWLERIKEH